MADESGRRSRKDDFEILGRLGSGSYGVVYKVLRKQDQNEYVMKSVRIAELGPTEQDEAINEVKLLASLDYTHVVRYYDSFVEKGTLYIVMEFCNQGDLQRMIKRYKDKGESSLPEKRIWSIFLQIVLGLHYIHKRRVLHRDMKSANVFLKKEPGGKHVVKIGDLGVAKALGTTTAFAHTVVGTPYYLSPELCEDKPYNDKSDVWALGVVLYECCTLDFPYTALNQCALVMKIVKDKPDPIPKGNVSDDLVKLCKRLLQKNPDRRPNLDQIMGLRKVQQYMDAHGYDLPEGIERVSMVPKAEASLPRVRRSSTMENKQDEEELRELREKRSPKRSPKRSRRTSEQIGKQDKEDVPRRRVWSEVEGGSGNLRGNRVRGRGGQSRVISKKAAKPVGVTRVKPGREAKKSVLSQSEDEYVNESENEAAESKQAQIVSPVSNRTAADRSASLEKEDSSLSNPKQKRTVPSLRDLQQAVEETTLEDEQATLKAGSRRSSIKTNALGPVSESTLSKTPSSARSFKEMDDSENPPLTGRSRKDSAPDEVDTAPNSEDVSPNEQNTARSQVVHQSGYDSGQEYKAQLEAEARQQQYPLYLGYQSQEGYSSMEEIPEDCLDRESPSPHKLQGTSKFVFQEGGWSGETDNTQWRVSDHIGEESMAYSDEDNPEEQTLGWSQKLRAKPMTEQLHTEYLQSQDIVAVDEEIIKQEEQERLRRNKMRQLHAMKQQQSHMNVLNALNNYQQELAGMVERQRTECISALGHRAFQDIYDLFSQQGAPSFDDEDTDYQRQVLQKCGGDMMSAWEAVYSIQKLLEMETAFREASEEKPSDFEDINAQEIEDEYSDEQSTYEDEDVMYSKDVAIPRNATIIVSPGKPAHTRDGERIETGKPIRKSLAGSPHDRNLSQAPDESDGDSVQTENGLDV